MTEFELVWDSRCGVAESPVWDASTRRLLFCDIPGKRINALSVDDGAHTSWDFPEVVGSFGLCRSGRIVVALRHRVVLFDPRTKTIEQLTDPVNEPPTNRLNDGKVGPDGCFWVGSMDENSPRQKTAALYRVTPQGRIERKAEGYAVSNGLAWSPDGGVMYHSDSTESARPRATRCPTASPGLLTAVSCTIRIPPPVSSRHGTSTPAAERSRTTACWRR